MNTEKKENGHKSDLTREQIEAEIQRRVEEEIQKMVREGVVNERIARTKLITKKKRKEIEDFFNGLKVKTEDQGNLFP